MTDHIASYWEYNQETNKTNCHLCPHLCYISEGKLGICHTRKNINNHLIALNYGKVASIALDPIEKKPLFHYKPGSQILSIGTYGCNMSCRFCQNYTISQQEAKTEFSTPEYIISLVNQVKDNIGIAFTYNEPFMWYEFMLDTAKRLKESCNKDVIVVTNGYVNQEPLEAILPFVDAFNIDLKTYSDSTYRKLCGATLDPVLNTIKIASKKSHVEVTTLMVTGENDTLEEIEMIAKFISEVDKDIPLHLSRYFPNYKMTKEATDVKLMLAAQELAKQYLKYVYVGNITNVDENTYCPNCHELLIERYYYQVDNHLHSNKCPKCGETIPIIL